MAAGNETLGSTGVVLAYMSAHMISRVEETSIALRLMRT